MTGSPPLTRPRAASAPGSVAPPPAWPPAALAVGAAASLGVLAVYLWAPLNPNVRYEAGVKIVGTGSAADTFSHRPLAFRLATDGVFRTADAMTPGLVAFEFAVRLLLGLLAVGAGVLLWQGLRRSGVAHAGLYGVVVVAALTLLGTMTAGEPEWLAVVCTAAGTGVALLHRRRPWLLAPVAGALLVAAAGMKLLTLFVALLGIGVVALVDRRQGLRTLLASIGVGVLYVLATLVWVPWEVQWLLDIGAVQIDPWDRLADAVPFFAELVARRPVLALLPAALVLAGRRERFLGALAVAATAALVVIQGQYFHYHAIPLVMVATILVLRAVLGRVSPLLGAGILALVAGASALTATSNAWQDSHQRLWVGLLVLAAGAGVAWAVLVRSRPRRSAGPAPLLAALATLALLYPGATPWGSQLLRAENPDGDRPATIRESRAAKMATAQEVHRQIGGETVPVTYLTPGEWPYFIGNPTSCRYPSPLFLQRTRQPERLGTASYAENLTCLSAPDARWLVIDPSWFLVSRQPADVQAVLDRTWDCSADLRADDLRLCPRRTR